MKRLCMLTLVLLAGCRTVTTTTTEIRPSRYAVLEFSRPVSHDAIVGYAQRAMTEQKIKIINVDADAGIVTGGPVKYDATNELPALDATVVISAESRGNETKVRVYASSVIESTEKGGIDARLMELAGRIQWRLNQMIGS